MVTVEDVQRREADLQIEVETVELAGVKFSSEISQLFAALAAAQVELVDPVKESTAKVQTKTGGAFTYAYVDLAGALRHARPVLAKQGLSVTQWSASTPGGIAVTTLIGHESGQWMSGTLEASMPGAERMNPLQALGAAISYLRRYAYLGAVGLAGEDSDANAFDKASKRNVRELLDEKDPVISEEEHRRIEAKITEFKLDRERIRVWAEAAFKEHYPDGIHFNQLKRRHARIMEGQFQKWRDQINAEDDAKQDNKEDAS